jgi:prepilin-type N-terminal cleavage/methylation domain-containing protein
MNITLRVQWQRGMSLVELMIAMLLGSLLIAGAVKIFSSNTQAFRLQQQVSSVQESARLTMDLLQADFRRAGQGGTLAGGQQPVQGWNDWAAAGSRPGLLAASDVIRVGYRAAEAMTDCEGNAAQPGDTIVNTYSVGQDTNPDIAALFCDGFVLTPNGVMTGGAGWPGVALLRGVESFQVNLGRQGPAPAAGARATVNGYGSPRAYMRPGALGNVANSSVIVAIRYGLVVRSEQGIQGMQAPANAIPLLDTSLTAAAMAGVKIDNKFPVHRAFVETVALRNTAIGAL